MHEICNSYSIYFILFTFELKLSLLGLLFRTSQMATTFNVLSHLLNLIFGPTSNLLNSSLNLPIRMLALTLRWVFSLFVLVCLGSWTTFKLVVGDYVCLIVGTLVNSWWCDHFGAMDGVWRCILPFWKNALETFSLTASITKYTSSLGS